MNQQNYGLIDGFIDGILERFGIDEELIKQLSDIVGGVVKNVEVNEVGDETYITIHLDKIHFKFKK
tara:strand:- start:132 stop:329 length:198 start_codon:yes stop_codon:yes gene_type:complete